MEDGASHICLCTSHAACLSLRSWWTWEINCCPASSNATPWLCVELFNLALTPTAVNSERVEAAPARIFSLLWAIIYSFSCLSSHTPTRWYNPLTVQKPGCCQFCFTHSPFSLLEQWCSLSLHLEDIEIHGVTTTESQFLAPRFFRLYLRFYDFISYITDFIDYIDQSMLPYSIILFLFYSIRKCTTLR